MREYTSLWNVTTSHGVNVRSTAANAPSKNARWGEPGATLCSEDSITTLTEPVEKAYQKILFPLAGARKRLSVPTPHSPSESTSPSNQDGMSL